MKFMLYTALLSALFFSALQRPASAQDVNVDDNLVLNWRAVGTAPIVLSGERFTLVNETLKQSLCYGKRGALGGINLDWSKSTSLNNFTIESKDGAKSPIKYGDFVAISVEGIKTPFLRYQKRDIGINLVWSGKPIFEWVVAGGVKGETLKSGTPFALFSTVEKDFLIYAKRGGKAINLRWYLDRNLGGYMDRVKAFVKKKGFEYVAKAALTTAGVPPVR